MTWYLGRKAVPDAQISLFPRQPFIGGGEEGRDGGKGGWTEKERNGDEEKRGEGKRKKEEKEKKDSSLGTKSEQFRFQPPPPFSLLCLLPPPPFLPSQKINLPKKYHFYLFSLFFDFDIGETLLSVAVSPIPIFSISSPHSSFPPGFGTHVFVMYICT